MLLKIVDVSESEYGTYQLNVSLNYGDGHISFTTEPFDSPFSGNLKANLAKYFSSIVNTTQYVSSLDSLVVAGKQLGEALLGEAHQCTKVTDIIQSQGFDSLDVEIESNNISFFTELWESLVLFDTPYTLSSVSRSFKRKWIPKEIKNHKFTDIDLSLNLKIEQNNEHAEILSALNGAPKEKPALTENDTLNIVHQVSHTNSVTHDSVSYALHSALMGIGSNPFVNYEVSCATDLLCVDQCLGKARGSVHLYHYDGPIITSDTNEQLFIVLNEEKVELQKLVAVLVKHNIPVLLISPSGCDTATMAKVAEVVHSEGLGNVVMLQQACDPWIAKQCFENVVAQILKGHPLHVAITEARKQLQHEITHTKTAQAWPILAHYSQNNVYFYQAATGYTLDSSLSDHHQINNKLFGFKRSMLPPATSPVSEVHTFEVLAHCNPSDVEHSRQVIQLFGQHGVGKTYVTHLACAYWAHRDEIDFGFYFDFSDEDYSLDDMQQMIAPVLGLDVSKAKEVWHAMSALRVCFVFDNVNKAKEQSNLRTVINDLSKAGHIVLLADHTEVPKLECTASFEVLPLCRTSQYMLAKQITETRQINDKAKVTDALLSHTLGLPWLINKVIPMLSQHTNDELVVELQSNLTAAENKVEQFKQWQWQKLSTFLKSVLILSNEVPNLLLELLMTATDRNEQFPPAQQYLGAYNEANSKLSEGLKVLECSGFIKLLPHGRIIDPDCAGFIRNQRADLHIEGVEEAQIRLWFSQMLCEGIRVASLHVVKQSNPLLSDSLLLNRRYWAKHFAVLWRAQDYNGFFAVKLAFDKLLQQFRLADESKYWALSLLTEHPLAAEEDLQSETTMAWLVLANAAIDIATIDECKALFDNNRKLMQWFESCQHDLVETQLPLFHQVSLFLQHANLKLQDWETCIQVSHFSAQVYTDYQAWLKVIASIKFLITCYIKVGDHEKVRECEARLLNEIPYQDAPEGTQLQQMLSVTLNRIDRDELVGAQTLLDKMVQLDGNNKHADMFAGLQSDIFFKQGEYEKTLPFLCQAWCKALEIQSEPQLKALQERFLEIEKHLSASVFESLFLHHTSDTTPLPQHYSPDPMAA
ncbi:hypothetical protein EAG18_20555 [Pseudoalteromonas sp. J010]|uniref:hypothetical protein n=1 Tax=Pseudoalteromonas sp. J010 TaxID=998465 RepID=UPI000F653400|nr:hypothetical protein [Pseudoalteromonas sp. J010]RRS06765.1 hypothetical protein EAG18_20555 [Pseudoalteromonas sp. J010]